MAGERKSPGESLTSRLISRAERTRLQRRSMPGGGEVFSGPLASRALKALGARAMTVDRAIVVGDEFDPSKPESQALYAHEMVHQRGSGGQGTHEARDAEETTARAVESMVLHRAMSGGYEGGYMPGGGINAPSPSNNDTDGRDAGPQASSEQKKDKPAQPGEGYSELRKQGLSHQAVVDRLARSYLTGLDEQTTSSEARGGDTAGTF